MHGLFGVGSEPYLFRNRVALMNQWLGLRHRHYSVLFRRYYVLGLELVKPADFLIMCWYVGWSMELQNACFILPFSSGLLWFTSIDTRNLSSSIDSTGSLHPFFIHSWELRFPRDSIIYLNTVSCIICLLWYSRMLGWWSCRNIYRIHYSRVPYCVHIVCVNQLVW